MKTEYNLAEEVLAARLYERYCAAVGGKAFNGDTLPNWPAFRDDRNKQLQRDAWLEVAREARRLFNVRETDSVIPSPGGEGLG